jgi:hypothetical protein
VIVRSRDVPHVVFTPGLGVLDLSDVQVLATVASLTGTADEDNLLVYSQESARLMEVDRAGNILGSFDFSGLTSTAEGVTIDADGIIYIVDEGPTLYTLVPAPVPVPPAVVLLGSAIAGPAAVVRRRKR